MNIKTGQLYWLKLEKESVAHPYVVISIAENTAEVIGFTTNRKLANMPGNVELDAREGNLEKDSIVDVSKKFTIQLTLLTKFIGSLSPERLKQIQAGRLFLEKSFLSN